MVIATGARGYVSYDFETSFGTGASFTGGSADGKRFGMQEKINTWTLNNSRINLATLNQTEIEGFAYGQETGSLGVGFVLSNPWLFGAIYGAPVSSGSGTERIHTYEAGLGTNSTRDVRSFETQIGLDFPSGVITRKLKGCTLRTFGLTCAIGSTVDCTADIAYSIEDAPDTSTALSAPAKPTTKTPFTFAHATLSLHGSASGDIIAKVQSADITFNLNPDMLWGIGSHQAVDAFRKVFEITGTFQASWVNTELLEHVLKQVKAGTGGAFEETIGGATPELEMVFTNGESGGALRKIVITLEGVSPTEHSVSGIEPVEPVFESIQWQAKSANIVAYNSEASEP